MTAAKYSQSPTECFRPRLMSRWDKEKGICPVPLRIIPDDVLEMAIRFAQTEDEYDVWYHTGDPAELRKCSVEEIMQNAMPLEATE